MNAEPLLSIVSPVYRAERIVAELVRRIRIAVEPLTDDFEIVLVEDGSPDCSWDAVVAECRRDRRVKGVQLSRNFGQHAAITAALTHARGRYVVVMDCDLQDNPDYIPTLFSKARDGFDVVFARRKARRYGFWKNVTARVYYVLLRWLASIEYDPRIGTYSLITRKVVDAFLQFGDYRRGYLIVLSWLGFSRGYVDVEHDERHAGRSSYSARKLLVHALTIMLTYSEKPLHLSIYLGFVLSALSMVAVVWLTARYFTSNIGQMALGWTSLVVSHIFLSGLILMCLGVIGLYIGRIFEQVKHRPIFVVRSTHNLPGALDASVRDSLGAAHSV
jgi:glycosyltransferase involved in cell wall biosynthesis